MVIRRGPLDVIWLSLSALAQSSRAQNSGDISTDVFWIFPAKEDSTASLEKLLQCLVTCTTQKFFPMFRWNFPYSGFCSLPSCLASLRGDDLSSWRQIFTGIDEIPPRQTGPAPSAFPISEVLQYPHHPHSLTLDLLQKLHAFLILRSPELDTEFHHY